MRAHRLSLSKLLPCLWWARGDVDCPDDPPGPKARIGKLVHRLSEGNSGFGRSFEQGDVDLSELAEALSIWNGPLKAWVAAWAELPGEHFVEARLRYDTDGDFVFATPRRDEPGYAPPEEHQVTGEIDFVRVLPDAIEQIDLKTGQKANSLESQLRAYAILGQRRWNRPLVRSAFLYARKTKVELTPWIEMDADEVDAEAGRLHRALRTLPQAERVKGEHCWKCPMGPKRGAHSPRAACPEWQRPEDFDHAPSDSRLYSDDVRFF